MRTFVKKLQIFQRALLRVLKNILSNLDRRGFKKYKWIIAALFLLFFYTFVFKIYYDRAFSIAFGDEIHEMMSGYLMNKGLGIYQDFFSQHNPATAYFAFFIQKVLHPDTLYTFILYHRLFVVVFSLALETLLIIRFGKKAILFTVLFELTKYYSAGANFQAESFIAVPCVYLLYLVIKAYKNERLFVIDYFMSVLFAWFIIVSREPFIPYALMTFILILILQMKRDYKAKISAFFLLVSSLTMTLMMLPLKSYFFQVFTVNKLVLADDLARQGGSIVTLFQSFFYPLVILWSGIFTHFRLIEVVVTLYFLAIAYYRSMYLKYGRETLLFIVLLGFIYLRPGIAGEQFYGTYKMLPWWAVYLSILSYFVFDMQKYLLKKNYFSLLFMGSALFCIVFFSPQSYLFAPVQRLIEFNTNYNRYVLAGEVMKLIQKRPTNVKDTLFVQGYDTLVFFTSNLNSPYPTYFYYGYQNLVPEYREKYEQLFLKSPPTFYYDDFHECAVKRSPLTLVPPTVRPHYLAIKFRGDSTCLYIHDSIRADIPQSTRDFIFEKYEYHIEQP